MSDSHDPADSPSAKPGADLLSGLLPDEETAADVETADPGTPKGELPPEADIDPARAAEMRDLAVAFRTAQSVGTSSVGVGGAAPVAGLTLGHAERDDPSQVDIGVGNVSDALSSLSAPAEPSRSATPAAAPSGPERASTMQIALRQAAGRARRKDETEELSELDLGVEVRPSRRKWILLGAVGVLVIAAAITTYVLLARRGVRKRHAAHAVQTRYAGKVDELVASQARRMARTGALVDPFAGVLARTQETVRSADVDANDQALNQSVPELDRWFEQALRRMSKRKAREQLLARGESLVKVGKHRRGRHYLFRAIRIRDGVHVRLLLGRSFVAEKRPRAAIPHLRRAVVLARRSPRDAARLELAVAYLAAKKEARACKTLRAIRKPAPEAKRLLATHCDKGGGGR